MSKIKRNAKISNSVLGFFEVEVKLQNALGEDGFKPRLLSEVPLFPENLKGHILVRRTGLKFDHHIVRVFKCFQVVLGSFFLVEQVRIEYVELVALDLLWWRMLLVVFLFDDAGLAVAGPVIRDSDSVDVLRFTVSEAAFGFCRQPVVELFFVLLHSLVFLKLHNLLSDEIIGFAGLSNKVFGEEVVIFGK